MILKVFIRCLFCIRYYTISNRCIYIYIIHICIRILVASWGRAAAHLDFDSWHTSDSPYIHCTEISAICTSVCLWITFRTLLKLGWLFNSPNSVSTLRGSYGRCERPGLDQGAPSGLRLNSRIKIPLRDVHVHFDCAGPHKVLGWLVLLARRARLWPMFIFRGRRGTFATFWGLKRRFVWHVQDIGHFSHPRGRHGTFFTLLTRLFWK